MTKRKCSVWWCDKPHYANGYCKAHDTAKKRYGSPFGKHRSQMMKVENEIFKARLVALSVTEFVTELDSVAVKACPFCERVGSHSALCTVSLSKTLLEETNPFSILEG